MHRRAGSSVRRSVNDSTLHPIMSGIRQPTWCTTGLDRELAAAKNGILECVLSLFDKVGAP
jgi:hypothetical protein